MIGGEVTEREEKCKAGARRGGVAVKGTRGSVFRRVVMVAISAGVVVTGVAVWGSPSYSQAPVVTVVDTVSGPNFQAFWKTVLIPAIKRNLGMDVSYTVGSGPTLQLQMSTWKPGHPEFTLLFLKGLDLSNMIRSGVALETLYPAREREIPNEKMEPKRFLASNNGVPLQGKGLIFWRAQFDLIYNAKFVKTPPKTWKEFYARRREFKGHIGLIRPDASSGGGRAFIYSFLTAFGVDFSKPLDELERSPAWRQAWDKFSEFSRYFAQPIASSPPVMFHQFQTEQVWLTDYAQDYSLWSAAQGQLPPTTRAAPLDVNVVAASNAWLAVPAVDTPAQKAAAYRVINFLLSPAIQIKMLETMYEYPGTSAWRQAPKEVWTKIPPVDIAEAHGIRMTNLDAITYIQKHGMDYIR
jgi:putative spermidine/putrescine transport system substrate-binding protein